MINTESIQMVEAAQFSGSFLKPLYESYCFSRIPGTLRALFGDTTAPALPAAALGPLAGDYDAVVLLFLDAFGWRFFQQAADDYPFLKRIVADGVASRLTSQFPSTTAAHVSTIHTGLPVGAHGVFEWHYYEPLVDAMISPLLFSFSGDRIRETLRNTRIDPAAIYPTGDLYPALARQGVSSTILQHLDYSNSPYTRVVTAGAKVVSYKTLPEALVTLSELRVAQSGPSYYCLYFDAIDSICHHYGPESPYVAAEIDTLLTTLERILVP
jgi:predicted AlkP superfamily pyrophosphatase or phosphodiesterase